MQKWRRGQAPYDGETPETHRQLPFSVTEYGKALDTLINFAEQTVGAQEFFAGMSKATGFNIVPQFCGEVE